jgi:hypothetical protein
VASKTLDRIGGAVVRGRAAWTHELGRGTGGTVALVSASAASAWAMTAAMAAACAGPAPPFISMILWLDRDIATHQQGFDRSTIIAASPRRVR